MGYAELDDVKTRLASDNITMSNAFNTVLTAKIAEVTADIDRMVGKARGQGPSWSFKADAEGTERIFLGRGKTLLQIDDCVEICEVVLQDNAGTTIATLTAGSDYLAEPLNRTPVTTLRRIAGGFAGRVKPWHYAHRVGVTARWGYADADLPDVREATIIEVIRSYLADRSGNDDRLGMTPFGAVVTAKAYTAKMQQLVDDYGDGPRYLG
jgi:hypothetical protein